MGVENLWSRAAESAASCV